MLGSHSRQQWSLKLYEALYSLGSLLILKCRRVTNFERLPDYTVFHPRNCTSHLQIYMAERQKRIHYTFVSTATSLDSHKQSALTTSFISRLGICNRQDKCTNWKMSNITEIWLTNGDENFKSNPNYNCQQRNNTNICINRNVVQVIVIIS
jgi:hypothetical protein